VSFVASSQPTKPAESIWFSLGRLRLPAVLGEVGLGEQAAVFVRVPRVRTTDLAAAGTVMHRSHLPIQEWFWAAFLVATRTPGISTLDLQRQLGIASCDTAWHLLHRLRKAMVNEHRAPLTGLVKADDTHVGGPARGKTLIVGAAEVLTYTDDGGKRRERAGQLRLRVIEEAGETSIGAFIQDNVEPISRMLRHGAHRPQAHHTHGRRTHTRPQAGPLRISIESLQ
jgi:hypothetical protein